MANRAGILLALALGACATSGPPPCGGAEPLGCSIPPAILVISEDYDAQADKFHGACVLHDLCYRHGDATYGHSREECDSEFYTNMKSACDGPAGLGVLDPEEFAKCRLAARKTYDAVRDHGEKHYRTTTSTFCDYRAIP